MPRKQYSVSVITKDIGPLGWIEGLSYSHDGHALLSYFGGLPYAIPPVGALRFRRPRALAPCYRYGHQGAPGRFTGKTGLCPQPTAKRLSFDEDCTQLNIYIPAGQPPAGGWPVMFFIHGGFLQFGSANEEPWGIAPLLSETAFKCIIVMPAYRLNAFGFLAGRELEAEGKRYNETAGNYGFWDQRLALEWTWKNVSLFGGDHSRITVAGYSAGGHSAFQQLAHELYFVPDHHKAIIKNIIMWSSSAGVQPKDLDEQQKQFDELTDALSIPRTASPEEKLIALRRASASDILAAQEQLTITEFRACSDGQFISKECIANVNSGDFAKRMKARGIRLMIGENRDEHNLYRTWRTPSDSYDALLQRLCADYPAKAAHSLMQHYCKDRRLSPGMKSWKELFGHIYADMQVHGLERGFLNALTVHGLQPGKDIFRYRFEKRMKCIDSIFPPAWGVTHATDMAIWFWGLDYADGLTDQEKQELKSWNEAFAAFVSCQPVTWHTPSITDVRRLTSDGNTDTWRDDRWEAGLKLWDVVNGASPVKARL